MGIPLNGAGTSKTHHHLPPAEVRAYSCKTVTDGSVQHAPCRAGPCPYPELPEYIGSCDTRCDATPGCRAFVDIVKHQPNTSNLQEDLIIGHFCYLYDRLSGLTVPNKEQPSDRLVRVCSLDVVGCPSITSNRTLAIVAVLRYETRNLREWMSYHSLLGVSHYVLISNECDDAAHAALLATAASAPCAPRLIFIHAFRCASQFQTKAYNEAVRILLSLGERPNMLIGFWDVDEFLVVERGDDDEGNAVDAFYRHGRTDRPMWVLDTKPFGPSGHEKRPLGFGPANYVMGSNLPPTAYGAFVKSLCTLRSMYEAWKRRQILFSQGKPGTTLYGMWPHHCLPEELGWRYPRMRARLNHYATRDGEAWNEKCHVHNPTFAANTRASKSFCRKDRGMQEFFARLSDHVDLKLFENLDHSPALPAPAALLVRSPLPPKEQRALETHCIERNSSLRRAALAFCARALSISPDSLRAPQLPSSLQLSGSCDCEGMGLLKHKSHKCGRSRFDDKSYCWQECCRPDGGPNLRTKRKPELRNGTLSDRFSPGWGSEVPVPPPQVSSYEVPGSDGVPAARSDSEMRSGSKI